MRDNIHSRSNSKTKNSANKEYVALRHNHVSRDMTVNELDRITSIDTGKFKKKVTDKTKRSASVKHSLKNGIKSRGGKNKSFERDHSGVSAKRGKAKGPMSTNPKSFALSPNTQKSVSSKAQVSYERRRRNENYQSIKTTSSPINLTNQQAFPLNDTSSTRAGTNNPFNRDSSKTRDVVNQKQVPTQKMAMDS